MNISLTNDAVERIGAGTVPIQDRKQLFHVLRNATRADLIEIGNSPEGKRYVLSTGNLNVLLMDRPGKPDEVIVMSVFQKQEPQTLRATGEVHDKQAENS